MRKKGFLQKQLFVILLLTLAHLILSVSTPVSVCAATYFVAPTGSDSNSGSESLPWRTIQQAATAAIAGDIVYVKAGTYNEQVVVANSGTAGNTITFAAYSNDVVIIDGKGITMPAWPSGLFHLENRNYIKVSGFRVINTGPNDNNCGIYVDTCHDIIIENNSTYNTASSGIGVWDCENVIIDSNEVELACNDGEQECISVAGTNNFEIRNNHVHHGGPGTNGGEGICAKDGSRNGKVYNNLVHNFPVKPGIYIDAWDKHTYNIEVFGNTAHDCGNDGIVLVSESGGLLENITVFNNIAYHNQNIGISVTPNGTVANPPMKNLKIINNTCYNNGYDTGAEPWGGGIGVDSPNLSGLIIRNNIVSDNLLFQIAVEIIGQNFSIDHNLIDGYRNELTEEIRGSDFIEGNPMFLNAAEADFHLQKDSPAIDKGTLNEAPNSDFDGNTRPIGASCDIGAFEYGAVAVEAIEKNSQNPSGFRLFQNYPNPFSAGGGSGFRGNPVTTIQFSVPKAAEVTLILYDITGREVETLVAKKLQPGFYTTTLISKGLPSGVYIYKLKAGSQTLVKRLTLLK